MGFPITNDGKRTFQASEALARGEAVKLNASTADSVALCDLGEEQELIGFVDSVVDTDTAVIINLANVSGTVGVLAGEAITANESLVLGDSGVVLGSSGGGHENIIGVALQSASASGSVIEAFIFGGFQDLESLVDFTAGEALDDGDALKLDGSTAGQVLKCVAGDEENFIGVAMADSVISTSIRVHLANRGGSVPIRSSAAITANAAVKLTADGEIVAAGSTGNEYIIGFAMVAATGADELIAVTILPGIRDRMTWTAGEAIDAGDALKLDGSTEYQVVKCVAGDEQNMIGVAIASASNATTVRVHLLTWTGTILMRSSAAIAANAFVTLAADGEIVTADTQAGQKVIGKLLDAASGADELKEVLLLVDRVDNFVFTAGGTIAKGSPVKANGTTAGEVVECGADDEEDFLGVALDAVSSAETLRVHLAGDPGTADVLSTGAITVHDHLILAASGKVDSAGAGAATKVIGIALEAAGGADVLIKAAIIPGTHDFSD